VPLLLLFLSDSLSGHGYLPGSDSDLVKDYLQPVATVFVALCLGAMAIDQYRTSNARFKCAAIFSYQGTMEEALAGLGLPVDGNYNNIRGYCRAFINPE